LWNTSAFQRRAYQPSFSTAAAKSPTGRLVTSFQSIGSRPGGGSSSRAWM
jgi:hypothetical protein